MMTRKSFVQRVTREGNGSDESVAVRLNGKGTARGTPVELATRVCTDGRAGPDRA